MTNHTILDWDKAVQVDETIEEYEYRRYPPNAGGVAMLNNPGEIRFNIESGDIFTHPHRSYLQIRGRLVKNDNTSFLKTDAISLANNAMLFLFSQIRYEIAGREIETILFPGQATTMLGLLEYSDDFAVTKGLNQCWFKDNNDYPDDYGIRTEGPVAGNKGFKVRHDYIFTSFLPNVAHDAAPAGGGEDPKQNENTGKFTFNIPLSHIFGFCKDYSKVIYGVKQELILTRKVDQEAIFSTDIGNAVGQVENGKVILDNIYWYVPQVKPSLGNLTSLMDSMKNNVEVSLGYNKRQVFSVILPGVESYSWNLTTKSATERPRFLVIAFQFLNTINQTVNPSVFKHLNIREIHVFLNNVRRYPSLDFTMNFSINNFASAFDAASNYKCLVEGIPGCVSNGNINPLDFKELYPLFVLDLSKQSSVLKTSIINVTVEMKFERPVNARAYTVLLSDKVFSLKADGKELKPVY